MFQRLKFAEATGNRPRGTQGYGSGNGVIRQNNTDVNPNRGGAGGTQNGRPPTRSFEGQGTERPNTPTSPNAGGWHSFNGPANPPSANPRVATPQGPSQVQQPGRYTNPNTVDRPAPAQPRYQGNSNQGNGYPGNVYPGNGNGRPPLDMRRPVVGGPQYNRPAPPERPAYSGNPGPEPSELQSCAKPAKLHSSACSIAAELQSATATIEWRRI